MEQGKSPAKENAVNTAGEDMNKTTVEQRRFNMHSNLLYDVITKQAGTLQKAVLEGVMNGVDAGASEIKVDLTHSTLSISDNGGGFPNREAIENFFETFGTPHVEGDAKYGRFRMGRGQLISFGINHWKTNEFRMMVDIKANGLDYNLETSNEVHPGCSIFIELYKELLPSEKDSVERELRQWVAWVDVPVILNGTNISSPPADAKWTLETPDAFYKLSATKSTLAVYNLGVLVMNAPASNYGIGGIVVSKERLDVNFARNDVQSDCPVFRRIKSELRKHSDQGTARKRKLSDSQRQHLAHRISAGDIGWHEGMEAAIITDIEGKHLTVDAFYRKLWHTKDVLAAERGNRVAIKVAQQRLAIALSQETLDRFDVRDVAGLVRAIKTFSDTHINDTQTHWYAKSLAENLAKVVPRTLDEYRHLVHESYETIDPKKLRANQKLLLRAVEKGGYVISRAMEKTYRKMLPGHSEVAQAWTDGQKAIWIEVRQLSLLSQGYQGCARMATLLIHEFLHDGPDTETHDHDIEFYERFHDTCIDTALIGEAAGAMMRYMAEQARRAGTAPTQKVGIFEDLEMKLIREGAEGSPVIDISGHDEGTSGEAA